MPEPDHTKKPKRSQPERSPVEDALRYLGTRQRGELAGLLEYAIERPEGTSGRALAPLLVPTVNLPGWTPTDRANAVLGLIAEGVTDRSVGPTSQSRRRRALQAAFRLKDAGIDAEIGEEWGSSLSDRFKQLRKLRGVFNDVTSTQPMEMAWTRGVRALSAYVDRRIRELQTPSDWERYKGGPTLSPAANGGMAAQLSYVDQLLAEESESFRPPSPGAQRLFVDLFITTVFMQGRAVHRRITERLVTARGDAPVPYYTARGFAVGKKASRAYVPVRALWGCREEFVVPDERQRPKRAPVTKLWFDKPLAPGEQAYFASEALFEPSPEEDDRDWIDVDIDHYGIPSGILIFGGKVPVRGLTIRVKFDGPCIPEAAWWYAEANEDERYVQPVEGDERLLPIVGGAVTHTFTDRVCQPREHYGVSFTWPAEAD